MTGSRSRWQPDLSGSPVARSVAVVRVTVVGAGVLGTLHAWQALSRGHEVVQIEREAEARGASLRNFGQIWVSGRAGGEELDTALRARELWEEIGARVPGLGFRANGSLTPRRTAAASPRRCGADGTRPSSPVTPNSL